MSKEIDYSRQVSSSADNSGNIFENGSRHPRWRGGIDKNTRKLRAATYRKYGIGIPTPANFVTDKAPKDIENNLDNFINGNLDIFISNSREAIFKAIKFYLPECNKKSVNKLLQKTSSEITAQQKNTELYIRIRLRGYIDSTTGGKLVEITLNRITQ